MGKAQLRMARDRMPWRFERVAPVDLRSHGEDPIGCSYLASGRPFLVDLPLSSCRALVGFPCVAESFHPLILASRAYIGGSCREYAGSALELYYAEFRPRDAAEALGIAHEDATPTLCDESPLGHIPPFASLSPAQRRKAVEANTTRGNRSLGVDVPVEEGFGGFGPVAEIRGRFEFGRQMMVLRSIEENGYIRNDGIRGDITAHVLAFERRFAYFVLSGNHRVCALAALGYERAPVRVQGNAFLPQIVRREEVDYWPQVRSGVFTRTQALAYFDRVFAGEPPSACESYVAAASRGFSGHLPAATVAVS